jgi:hypothetical protein
MWSELQAKAAENKWGLAGVCIQKSELVSWDEDDICVRAVLRAPIRAFCDPGVVSKVQDRLTECVQKPVQVTVLVKIAPISTP